MIEFIRNIIAKPKLLASFWHSDGYALEVFKDEACTHMYPNEIQIDSIGSLPEIYWNPSFINALKDRISLKIKDDKGVILLETEYKPLLSIEQRIKRIEEVLKERLL